MQDVSFHLDETFSWPTALSLALASKLAFEMSSSVETSTAGEWGFPNFKAIESERTSGFIAARNGAVLLSLRSKQSFGAWVQEDHKLEIRSYGGVHFGTLLSFGSVEKDIRSFLSNFPEEKIWLTGHGLGGAIACVAAAELIETRDIAGVYTFGQPRPGDQAFASFCQRSLARRFVHFVNDRDLVCRVPSDPFYPAGDLVFFDANGQAHLPDSGGKNAAPEPDPYPSQKFAELQGRAKQLTGEVLAKGLPDNLADISLEGLFPSLGDNRLERYLGLIQRYALTPSSDPLLRTKQQPPSAEEESLESFNPRVKHKSPAGRLSALVRLKGPDWKPPAGVTIGSRVGNIVSAQGSIESLRRLEADEAVESVEVSRDAGGVELSTSVPFVGADTVHRPPIDERGDAALVGLIDTGIDVLHETFRDAQGQTRILAIWDQFDNTGPSPHAVDAAHFEQDFGTLYLAADIQNFINGTKNTPADLRDPNMHGTHVASIAVGRAVGAMADGMAPEAGIVVVKPKMRTLPGDPQSIGYSVSHFEALAFLKRVSDGGTIVSQAPRPMAVNVSLGMNAGAHDGTSSVEATFDSISRKGQAQGFVIVKSAGNERGWGGHARLRAFEGVMEVKWESAAVARDEDYIEVWYDSADELEFTLLDPAGNATSAVSRANRSVSQTLGGNLCKLELTVNHKDNGDKQLLIIIEPAAQNVQGGRWTLRVQGMKVRSERRQIDVWVERDDQARALARTLVGTPPVMFTPETEETTLSIPGTADTVICVSACQSHNPLQVDAASSYGPTRTGRPKPDVCAPGVGIVAAKAGTNDHKETTSMTGTSMASPHVTGALALVLSHRQKQAGTPQHNAVQLRAALNRTAVPGALHHPAFGYGKLDVLALFNDLL